MRFLLTLLFSACTLSFCVQAQHNELISTLQEIEQNLQPVEQKNATFSTSLSYDESAPYIITLSLEETDNKGEETTEFQLNLAYLNERQVKWESSRKEMTVNFYSKDKFIQVTQNGDRQNYEDELAIPCLDVDNARILEELFQKAIPLANKVWQEDTQLPGDFEGLRSFVINAVSDVQEGDEMYVQKLKPVDAESSRFTLSKRYISDKGEETDLMYTFNFTDIHPPGISTQVKGKSVYVALNTDNRQKFIEVTDGENTNYTDEVEIQAASYEDAQLLTVALRRFVPEARENYNETQPAFQSSMEALGYLNEAIQSYTINRVAITQADNQECLFELEREAADDKSTEALRFLVDISDLAPNTIEIDVSAKGIWVTAATKGNNDYVMPFENGEQQNYTDAFSIGAADIPNAKAIRHGLTEAINNCQGEVSPEDFAWMSKTIEEGNNPQSTIEQQLSVFEDNACKVAFTVIESGKRETTEERYEFNLHDLDENTVALNTKGTTAYVQAGTVYKERTINYYKEDGSVDYENSVAIIVPDIASGKVFMETLTSLIKKCKE